MSQRTFLITGATKGIGRGLSEQSGFITGQTLFVDGGASLSKAGF
jgi:NAD(P)-dependent dehydrogenase (short-subunit alcohol dehydrogenase family)